MKIKLSKKDWKSIGIKAGWIRKAISLEPDEKPKTGKYSQKPYECIECGNKITTGTNHWGEIYPYCSKCHQQTPHKCLDPVPEGYDVPEKWKMVNFGDLFK